MGIDRVVIVPAKGADGVGFDFGNMCGVLTEYDIVTLLADYLAEFLELYRVRTSILPVRKRPGIPPLERHLHIPDGSLAILFGLGWQKTAKRNGSIIATQMDPADPLIKDLDRVLTRWGIVTHADHSKTLLQAPADPILTLPQSLAIRIEPFALNGPNSSIYASRIEPLARALAQQIAEWLALHHSRSIIQIGVAAAR